GMAAQVVKPAGGRSPSVQQSLGAVQVLTEAAPSPPPLAGRDGEGVVWLPTMGPPPNPSPQGEESKRPRFQRRASQSGGRAGSRPSRSKTAIAGKKQEWAGLA